MVTTLIKAGSYKYSSIFNLFPLPLCRPRTEVVSTVAAVAAAAASLAMLVVVQQDETPPAAAAFSAAPVVVAAVPTEDAVSVAEFAAVSFATFAHPANLPESDVLCLPFSSFLVLQFGVSGIPASISITAVPASAANSAKVNQTYRDK
jgi:hypothetical protein